LLYSLVHTSHVHKGRPQSESGVCLIFRYFGNGWVGVGSGSTPTYCANSTSHQDVSTVSTPPKTEITTLNCAGYSALRSIFAQTRAQTIEGSRQRAGICQGRSKSFPLRRRKREPLERFRGSYLLSLGAAEAEPCDARQGGAFRAEWKPPPKTAVGRCRG